jgi:hypothetical protein
MNTIEVEDENLLETEEEESRYRKAVKHSYKTHYSKTKAQINRENHHILSTQAKCLRFVKKYRGHAKVCHWCRKNRVIRRWKWVASAKVWYRFYGGRWHYWGPSKTGFTRGGWTFYKGYWHHRGYVFKFIRGMWYRFQGKRWVKYGARVPLKPGVPRGPKICRPFYILKKWGFPTSLSAKRLPRCQVGRGRRAAIYAWKNHAACRFLGGKLVYHRFKVCKAGRPHKWARVTRCVRGPVLTNKGFNYKTGQKARHISRRSRYTVISGLVVGKCYRFRAYSKAHDYLWDYKGALWSGKASGKKSVFQVLKGKIGKRGTVTLASRLRRGRVLRHQGYRMKIHSGRSTLWKKDASFYAHYGLVGGRKYVSLRSYNYGKYFLAHAGTSHVHKSVWIRKYQHSTAFKRLATWKPIRTRC